MYIPQKNIENLKELITQGKVIIIYGARRVGKTTLIRKFIEQEGKSCLLVNGDDIVVQDFLSSRSINKLKEFVGDHSLLIIDEAQYIKHIGLNLKLIVDHIPGIRVIATGSSSFELAEDIGEPLAGRKYVLPMFPLAQMEIATREERHQTQANLDARLIYGSYPEVVIMEDNRRRQDYLRELVSSYLFKDILALEGIRHADKLVRLLQLLAYQIGKEVSLSELGRQLGMSKGTVQHYLDLLEKVFVLYSLDGFSRNLRKEITKNSRYFFHDNGIRNAVINNFNPLSMRNDIGELWENYVVMERMKRNKYLRQDVNTWFWRTYDQHEIDLVEESQGRLIGYEIKWQERKAKAPASWMRSYPQAEYHVITRENYLEYIK